jgi:hypothetical protein
MRITGGRAVLSTALILLIVAARQNQIPRFEPRVEQGAAKPFLTGREVVLKHGRPTVSTSNEGDDYADHDPECDLRPIPARGDVGHRAPGGMAMIESTIARLVFLSLGIFLAHAFDAYRTNPGGTRAPRY